jgi:hypothetical protein
VDENGTLSYWAARKVGQGENAACSKLRAWWVLIFTSLVLAELKGLLTVKWSSWGLLKKISS